MLDSNVSTYIDKDGNVQEVGSGGSEYANTSEIVDNAITLTSTSTLADLATQILAQKTKVVRAPWDDNLKRILPSTELKETNYVMFKVFSIGSETNTPSGATAIQCLSLMRTALSGTYWLYEGYIYSMTDNIYVFTGWQGSGEEGAYPIGSIYMSTNNFPPSASFGGTWTALPDVGTDETASLVMTNTELSSGSFSYYKGAGSVTSDEMRVFHNYDYSIIQVTGRLNVTPTNSAGGVVGIKFNIGNNIIKKAALRRQCGFYYDGNGAHESIWADADTSGNIFFYNNSSYINLPSTQTTWSIWLTLFNKASDGDTMYRWKRIA